MTTELDLRSQHRTAMGYASQALIALREGNEDTAMQLFQQAYQLEARVAQSPGIGSELTRVVLLRSAASLALDAGEYDEAEQLVAQALLLHPNEELAEELRTLHERAQFQRHLELDGITLLPNELQLALAGPAISDGLAPSETVLPRLRDLERLITRTAERLLGLEFREDGAALPTVNAGYRLYVSVPRPGSFAVTLRLGQPEELPDPHLASRVIDTVLDGIHLVQTGQHEHLRERIGDAAYYRNFVSLARSIAPDLKHVALVGLSAQVHGTDRRVQYTRPRREIALMDEEQRSSKGVLSITGWLKLGETTRKKQIIQIRNRTDEELYIVSVPTGMLSDVVRPLWDRLVTVYGQQRKKRHLDLLDIEPAE